MVTIRYGDIHREPAPAHVTGMGLMPGPPGGDGWQIVARLPQGSLPATSNGRYAILVSGRIQNTAVLGVAPVNGVIQVALGTTFGTISPNHEVRVFAGEALPNLDGIPFQVAMVMNASPSIVDPTFGATWDNTSGSEFCIYARSAWNGDPLAYTVTFDVADVTWVWFDTSAIPGADILCERFAPAVPVALTLTQVGIYSNINSPGTTGQKWLHFHNIVYRPRRGGIPIQVARAPTFEFGFVGAGGWTPQVGTNGRWGMARGAISQNVNVRLHQGCFWYGVQPSGTFLPAVFGNDQVLLAAATLIERYTYVGIRLDNLLDVLTRTDVLLPNATGNLGSSPAWPTVYTTLERPATGIVSAPCVMMHGIVQSTGRQAYGPAITTNLGQSLSLLNGCDQSDLGLLEGISTMAFAPHGLSRGQPDLQYRVHFAGGTSAPPLSQDVRDFTVVQFNLVRDPVVDGVEPVTPGNPVVIVPGKESPDPGSLNPPPIAPNAETPESPELVGRERIDGATGEARTWPNFVKPRRFFDLTWEPLSESQAATMATFLVANPAFRYSPPRGTAIAVLAMDAPQIVQAPRGGQTYSIRLRVAELIVTGA